MFAKKVLGVIISVEVATHQPPILFLPVDGVLVDCCLSFCTSLDRYGSQLQGDVVGHDESLVITPEIASQNNSRANVLKYSHTEFRQSLKEIPQHRHKTYHSTVKAIGVSLNTVQ